LHLLQLQLLRPSSHQACHDQNSKKSQVYYYQRNNGPIWEILFGENEEPPFNIGESVHHFINEVPFFDADTQMLEFKIIQPGHQFTLWEWLDHMISASANSAASTVWKELILMRVYGEKYPPSSQEESRFFDQTAKPVLQQLALAVINDVLRSHGILGQEWQHGTFFTGYGQRIIPGVASYASPRALLKFLYKLESGTFIDEWSSLEMVVASLSLRPN